MVCRDACIALFADLISHCHAAEALLFIGGICDSLHGTILPPVLPPSAFALLQASSIMGGRTLLRRRTVRKSSSANELFLENLALSPRLKSPGQARVKAMSTKWPMPAVVIACLSLRQRAYCKRKRCGMTRNSRFLTAVAVVAAAGWRSPAEDAGKRQDLRVRVAFRKNSADPLGLLRMHTSGALALLSELWSARPSTTIATQLLQSRWNITSLECM
eukprot:6281690-Amphidinium_carterae.3